MAEFENQKFDYIIVGGGIGGLCRRQPVERALAEQGSAA